MDAESVKTLEFLGRPQQQVLPIYQRGYGWTNKECKTLFENLVDVGTLDMKNTWYIGAIVCQDKSTGLATPVFVVIDGQQRLTTITITICAITEFLRKHPNIKLEGVKNWDSLLKTYVVNSEEEGDKWYRLLLNNEDKEDLKELIYKVSAGEEIPRNNGESRIFTNYNFMRRNINKNNIVALVDGLRKLEMIFIRLSEKDVAQNIFETLNSTGRSLQDVDKIRNYLLMGLENQEAEEVYYHYWRPMERAFSNNLIKKNNHFEYFARYYLMLKLNTTIRTYKIYEQFRKVSHNFENAKECVKELKEYSQYYLNVFGGCEKDKELCKFFSDLDNINMRAMSPLLLKCYKYYIDKKISREKLIEIYSVVMSYYFRRSVCGWGSVSGLDALSVKLCKILDQESPYQKIVQTLCLFKGRNRFLSDKLVTEEVYDKNFMEYGKTHFILTKLVNKNVPALMDTSSLSVECIYPEVNKEYLGKLGNLTLNGVELCMDIQADSPEEFIDKRTEKLTEMILQVWEYPTL